MPIDGSTAAQWVPTGSVTVRTPGKINLYLAVGDLLESGYHELTTVFHAVSLVDEVTVSNADVLSLEITGEGADQLPLDERNLAWRAAELMAEHVGRAPDVSILIDKSIPVAGGMGGGSADAAAVLVALNSLWELGVPRRDLHALAAQLGSDVPFALHGGTALGTGRGEELATVLARNTFHWVLAFAEGGLSTRTVFSELDRLIEANADGREEKVARYVVARARRGDAADVIRVIDEFCYNESFLINVGDEKGAILDAAIRRAKPRRVLELGAYCGYSALRMAVAAPEAKITCRAQAATGTNHGPFVPKLTVDPGTKVGTGPISGSN